MGKTLVIVESPTKAKTIRRFLGKGYSVKSTSGHIRDLPRSQFGVDVEKGFLPKYITIRGKGDVLKELRAEAKKSSRILLGPDPDREGEAIAWHLQQILGLDESEPCRIEFNEITQNAIKKAVKSPRMVDNDRVDAQQARRVLDRLVGYNLSPLLWKKVRKGLSAGRVQSVAVKLIIEREREIEEFVPEEYWTLTALLKKEDVSFEAKLFGKGRDKVEIHNEEQMQEVLGQIEGRPFVVQSITKKQRKRKPSAPFVTSTLQQEAYKRLNFTARKTMMVAQQLYEGIDLGAKRGAVGLITYIRTDSPRISDDAVAECRGYVADTFGQEYIPEVPNRFETKKKAQGAHEAIRPTTVLNTPDAVKEHLSRDQLKLYRLIWERFVSSQMSPAVLDVTTVEISAGGFIFRANGSVLKFPGFLKLMLNTGNKSNSDLTESLLPPLEEGEELLLEDLVSKQHFTQPPPRYSEGTLVKTLEELGIGRPSTYAPIIDTIVSRGYVVREDKQFFPTELGVVVIDLLDDYFKDILDVEFTANLEEKLDKVESGELEWRGVVSEFYKEFEKELEKAEREIGQVEVEEEVTDKQCEKCGRNMVVKYGRYGKFLACPGFPECRNAKPFLEEIGVSCPLCGGEVVLRRSKKGRKFFGCAGFPECEYVSWNRPTEDICPRCSSRLVEKYSKSREKRLVCSSEECSYQREDTRGEQEAGQQQGVE